MPLTAFSDDSDEEDGLYGHNVGNGKIELQLMPPQNGQPTRHPKPQRRVIQPPSSTRTVVCWMGCILTLCVVIAVYGIVKWSGPKEEGLLMNMTTPVTTTHGGKQSLVISTTPGSRPVAPGKDWQHKMENHG